MPRLFAGSRIGPFAFLSLALLAAAPVARAVAVHGLEHTAVGGAVVSASPTPDGGVTCAIDGLGSSGADGVDIALAGADGVSLRFAPRPVGSPPVASATLSLRMVVGGVTSLAGTAGSHRVGADRVLTCDAPGALDCVIEVWDGASLVYSAVHPVGTPVTLVGRGDEECDDGDAAFAVWPHMHQQGIVHRDLACRTVLRTPCPVSVDGHVMNGDGVVMRLRMASDVGRPTSARLLVALDAPGSIALTATRGTRGGGVVTSEPMGIFCGSARPPFGTLASGALALGEGTIPGSLSLALDGSGLPGTLRFDALPPSSPPGAARCAAIECDLASPPLSALSTLACAWADSVEWLDDTSGVPVTVAGEDRLTWATGPAGLQVSIAPGDPTTLTELHVLDASGAAVTLSHSGSFVCDAPPAAVVSRVADDRHLLGLRWAAPGATVMVDGVPVLTTGIDFACRIARHRIHGIHAGRLMLDPTTSADQCPTVLDAFALPLDGAAHAGGLAVVASGPSGRVTHEAGSLVLSDLSADGEDGIDLALEGASGLQLVCRDKDKPFIVEELSFHGCPDGACSADGAIRFTGSDLQGAVAHLTVECPAQGGAPLFVEVGGTFMPLAGGGLDLIPDAGKTVQLDRIRHRWISPWSESWQVRTRDSLRVRFENGDVPTEEFTVWRNRGGEHVGAPTSPPMLARLRGRSHPGPLDPVAGDASIAIDEPGVHVAGCTRGPRQTTSLDGTTVTDTWVVVGGPGDIRETDQDCGGPSLRVPASLDPDWSPPLTTLTAVAEPGTHGFLFKSDLSALAAAPDTSRFQLQMDGDCGGTACALWDLDVSVSSTGTVVECGPPASRGVRVVSGGVVLRDGPAGASLAFDLPPARFRMDDCDDDGHGDVAFAGFAAGAHVWVDGLMYACDSVVVEDASAPPTTTLASARAMIHRIHRGEHLRTLLARMPGAGTTAGVDAPVTAGAPLALAAPFPNPARGASTLVFALGTPARVRATVLDVTGREIARLADGRFPAGAHALRWDGTGGGAPAPAGLYFVRVERDGAPARVARLTRLR